MFLRMREGNMRKVKNNDQATRNTGQDCSGRSTEAIHLAASRSADKYSITEELQGRQLSSEETAYANFIADLAWPNW
jgi:hypothetical protein